MKYLLLIILLIFTFHIGAQNVLPHKAAKSTSVIIREGKENIHWKLDPKAASQDYYLKHPHRNQRVTFITDNDSISFQAHYGGQYELVVELPDSVYCFVRIVAKEKNEKNK